jgi:hypothetical protein
MDILLTFILAISFLIGLVLLLPSIYETTYQEQLRLKTSKILLLPTIIGIIWLSLSYYQANKTVKTTIHPIETHLNIPFFVSPNNNFIELQGNSKFADQNKYQIKYTIKAGLWKYGIYVTEAHYWEIVPKQPE